MPIGWTSGNLRHFSRGNIAIDIKSGAYLFLGWLISAVATLFGAPFWFDSLQKIIRLKEPGPSPAEKQANTAAAV